MNTREDSLGFPVGLMVVVFSYTVIWAAWNLGYGSGVEDAKCREKHSYHMDSVKWFGKVAGN